MSHSADPTYQHSERNKERKKSGKNERKKEGRKRQARMCNQSRKRNKWIQESLRKGIQGRQKKKQ